MSGPPAGAFDDGSVHVMTSAGRTRLVLAGEIDLAIREELTAAVHEVTARNEHIEVDVRHVTFMDSIGIAQLARLANQTKLPATIIKPPEVVRFLLDVTKLGDVFTVVEEDPGFPSAPPPDPGDSAV